jgi:LuxR family maltose regulon positive regulatory protein
MHLAGGYQLIGRRAEAVQVLNESLARTPGGGADQASALATLCFVELLSADANALMRAARQLERFSAAHALPSSAAFAAYFAGIAHYDRNDLPAAEVEFRKAFDARYITPLHNAAHSGFALAVTVHGLGRHDEAEGLVDAISEFVLEARNPYFAAMAEAFRAELDLRHGQPANAARWALGYDPGPLHPDPRFYLPQLTLVRMLLTRPSEENTKRARKLLDKLGDHTAATHNARRALEVSIFRVLLLDAEGDEAGALHVLRGAVEVASGGGVIRPFFEHGKRIGELLDRMESQERTALYLEELTAAMPGAVGRVSDPSTVSQVPTPLSNRESDVLALLAERLTNKEIAGKLFISPDTAKRHTVNIYQKLEVHGRREAVAKALELGILHADSRTL